MYNGNPAIRTGEPRLPESVAAPTVRYYYNFGGTPILPYPYTYLPSPPRKKKNLVFISIVLRKMRVHNQIVGSQRLLLRVQLVADDTMRCSGGRQKPASRCVWTLGMKFRPLSLPKSPSYRRAVSLRAARAASALSARIDRKCNVRLPPLVFCRCPLPSRWR